MARAVPHPALSPAAVTPAAGLVAALLAAAGHLPPAVSAVLLSAAVAAGVLVRRPLSGGALSVPGTAAGLASALAADLALLSIRLSPAAAAVLAAAVPAAAGVLMHLLDSSRPGVTAALERELLSVLQAAAVPPAPGPVPAAARRFPAAEYGEPVTDPLPRLRGPGDAVVT